MNKATKFFSAFILVMTMLFSVNLLARGGGYRGGSHRSYSGSSYSHSSGITNVRGYYRKNGTYVSPHRRTSPNGIKSDNWSHKGNINPDTGVPGTKED